MSEEPDVIRRGLKNLWKKLPLESGNYPYVCARVRAKKALLYPPDMYQKFLQMKVPQISRTLGEGDYREEMLALGTRFSGVDLIEAATRDNLARTYTKILDFSEGELKRIISEFINRWDVYNIETILRGKHYGADCKEILEDVVPAGTFTDKFLKQLAEQEGTDEAIEFLRGTEFFPVLEGAKKECEACGTMAPYEDALLRHYYSVLLDTVKPTTEPANHFVRFIRMEIDMINLRTLLRLVLSKADVKGQVFIEGGLEMSAAELSEMLKMDWDGIVNRLKKRSFYETIAPGLKDARQKGLNEVMRILERYSLKQATRHASIHPLSILPVIDYMLAKKNEVDNIRIVARGKESGLDNETIKGLLLLEVG